MTSRAWFEQKKRRIVAWALIGFALAAGGTVLAKLNLIHLAPNVACLPGGALFVLALLYGHLFAFRCPQCHGPWDALAMNHGRSLFGIDRRIRFCPFCGCNIDIAPGTRTDPE